MWSLFYRRPRLLILTLCLIFIWGFFSYQLLPRMEDPNLTQRSAVVTTRFPGASPERVESLVTEAIEQELFEIEEIDSIDSFSTLGFSTIFVILQDKITDADEIWSRVRDRLADVTAVLPQGASEPEYQEIDARAYTMLAGLTWDLDAPANYAILSRLAEELEADLRALQGTEKIKLFGAPQEEIVVEINPADLSALGLTPQELSKQIQMSDAKVSAGQLRSTSNDLLIEIDALDTLERIREIPIHSGNSGQLTRLGDVAQVRKGIKEPPSNLALVNGQEAVVLAILMEADQRIDRWAGSAYRSLENFRQNLPDGISLTLIFDQSRYVNSRLNNLFENLLLGALCVVGTTFLMMGWKSALVVSSTLPLSVLMVFGGMKLLAIPLHQMSVTGLVIALGLLIDNAVVVVDEVQTELRRGLTPQAAIAKSVSYLALPLLASTLTTILAFLPIVLLPGSTGEFVRTIALNVILALLSSLFLSLTVIPALTGLLQAESGARGWWHNGLTIPPLTRAYRRTLAQLLARPLLGVVLALLVPLTGFLVVGSLKEQFFPPAERDQVYIEFELQPQASLQQTQELVEQADRLLGQSPQLSNIHWFIGTNAPAFYYNLPRGGQDAANYASSLVQLRSTKNSREFIQSLQSELDQAFPAAKILVRQLEQGPDVAAPIELRLYGPDLERLRELGNQLRAELIKINHVTYTNASLAQTLPKLAFQVDEEQARLAGLDNRAIAEQLDANLEGTVGGSILEATEELPVRVRLSGENRGDLDRVASLELLPDVAVGEGDATAVPLSTLGKMELVPELASIPRRNGKRVNTVQGYIAAGVLPSEVLANFKAHLEAINFQLPSGYHFEFGGESAERTAAVDNLMSTVSTLLVLMIATLVLSFSSFRSASIIVVVGISSVGLGFASLWIFNYPLGFMAILGTVGLIGIAINDSIVVLSALRSDAQARQGNRQAMREVVIHSTRHVLTTTITTIAGFVPLLLNGGKFWPPLAICIAGGVGGATLLALFFVPCAYLLLIKRDRREIDQTALRKMF